MPDNPHTAPGVDFPLPGHRVIALEGPQAVAFAQAQTMNDVAALPDGHWHWNGWLTPKGRVVALFALVRLAPDAVWLVVADAEAGSLAAALGRFVFRSKVAIRVREDLAVTGAFGPPQAAEGTGLARLASGAVELDMGGDGGARRLVVTPVAGATPASDSPDTANAWAAFDLAHGWPRLPADQVDAWTPQQLSLERLRAYSVKKGCYPGQEIVARTHFLGRAKRGLVRLRGFGLDAGGTVRAGEAQGTVVCVADGEALAVMPLEATPPYAVDGASIEAAPLLAGLAR